MLFHLNFKWITVMCFLVICNTPLGIAPFLYCFLNYTEEWECPRLKGITGPCRILFQLAAFPPAVPDMANKIYQSQRIFKEESPLQQSLNVAIKVSLKGGCY